MPLSVPFFGYYSYFESSLWSESIASTHDVYYFFFVLASFLHEIALNSIKIPSVCEKKNVTVIHARMCLSEKIKIERNVKPTMEKKINCI